MQKIIKKVSLIMLAYSTLSVARAQLPVELPAIQITEISRGTQKPTREVHLIYMGGNDCPPCVAWRKDELPKLKQAGVFQLVKFSFVTKSISSPVPARFFLPSEAKPHKEKLDLASNGISGSPQFAVFVNGEVFDYYTSTRPADFVEKMLVAAESDKPYPMKRCLKKDAFRTCQQEVN